MELRITVQLYGGNSFLKPRSQHKMQHEHLCVLVSFITSESPTFIADVLSPVSPCSCARRRLRRGNR